MSKHYTDEDVQRAARMTKCSIVDGQDAANVYCLAHDNPVRGGLPHCIGYEGALVEARAVLDAVAPAIAARALREYADELERELVCCDAFDGKGNKSGHSHCICYWGGAAAHGARQNADRIERGES